MHADTYRHTVSQQRRVPRTRQTGPKQVIWLNDFEKNKSISRFIKVYVGAHVFAQYIIDHAETRCVFNQNADGMGMG